MTRRSFVSPQRTLDAGERGAMARCLSGGIFVEETEMEKMGKKKRRRRRNRGRGGDDLGFQEGSVALRGGGKRWRKVGLPRRHFSSLLFFSDRTEVGGEEKWAGVGFDQKRRWARVGFWPR